MVLQMSRPHLDSRTGVYYIRRRVPDVLRHILGKSEYKRSLETKDRAEAARLFPKALEESNHLFELARKQLSGEVVLNAIDAMQLAARWAKAEQERVAAEADYGHWLMLGFSGDSDADTLRFYKHEAPKLYKDFVLGLIQKSLDRHHLPLGQLGINLKDQLFDAFEAVALDLSDWCYECWLNSGRYIEPPALMPVKRLSSEKVDGAGHKSLSGLWSAYATMKASTEGDNLVKSTLSEYEGVFRRLIELYGDLPLEKVNRELIADYVNKLAATPSAGSGIRSMTAPEQIAEAQKLNLPKLTKATIRKRLQSVSAVLSYGAEMGWLKENPVTASRLTKRLSKSVSATGRVKTRKDYTQAELIQIFTSRLFVAGWRNADNEGFGAAMYWIPLLAIYTGARSNELAQLRVTDLREVESGIWCLSILADDLEVDRSSERRVKNENSRREVPLHPDLLSLGLIEYAKKLPHKGQLFPQLKRDKNAKYSSIFGKRWASYLNNDVGLDSPAMPMHGFRHTFKTMCRDSGIPRDVHERITGHRGGSVGDSYGSQSLIAIYAEIRKLPSLVRQAGLIHA